MKFSEIQCPYCGATEFTVVEDDILQCAYCNKKFGFDHAKLLSNGKNAIFVHELTAALNAEKESLKTERKRAKLLLDYCMSKASRRTLKIMSAILLITAAVSLIWIFFLFYALYLFLAASAAYAVVRIVRKILYRKYHPIALRYASEVARCDDLINRYDRLISKYSE